jgi:hypothetical protein
MVLQVACVFKAVGRKQKTKKHMRGYMALLPPPVPPCGGPRSGGSGPEDRRVTESPRSTCLC